MLKIEHSKKVHNALKPFGHDLRWNVKDPNCHIGSCACGFKVEVTDDNKRRLTMPSTKKLKPCRLKLNK